MNDWVVETPSFEEDLMNNRVVMLNQNGVNRVVEIIKEKDKEIERLNKFLRAFSDFIDDEEYWKSLGVNGEDIECKVSHKWNELLYKIVHKGSDKE